MSRAENIGPNQNISGVNAPKPKTVKGPNVTGLESPGLSDVTGGIAPNVDKYFDAGKGLGLSDNAANLLADLTAKKFDGKLPKDKGGIVDKKA